MITQSQLIEAVRCIAGTKPDYIYRASSGRCTYRPNINNPDCGCIVGEALLHLGVPVKRLERIDQRCVDYDPVAWGTTGPKAILADLFEPDALDSRWVASVQFYQDQGHPWAAAIRRADEKAAAKGWVAA